MFDPQKWGPFIVVIWLLTLMSVVVAFTLLYGLPRDGQGQMIVGAVITAFAAGYGFYLNTSTGSKAKDATIAQMAANTQTALLSTPPPAPSASGPGAPAAAFLMLAGISLAFLLSGQPASAASPPAQHSAERNCIPYPQCLGGLPDGPTPNRPPPQTQDAFEALKKLIVDDLTWAQANAAAQHPPDTRHGKCWAVMLSWLNGPNSPTFVPPHLGIASALQLSFDLSGGVGRFIPDDVADGCGATSLDARLELMQLLRSLGITSLFPK